MKQLDPYQLREVLNYDTNQESNFDLVERNQIHRAISQAMASREYELPKQLAQKIKEVRAKIKANGYQPKELVYYLDTETMLIQSKPKPLSYE